ncbi:hypothetical protein [Streptomyces sp. NPDC056192]|uniref:hypothetical protein n=1 Tax=Streptomyces sp. NPDC056192 TaxID=3345743 RepID=UPI0035DDDE7B
MTNPNACRWCGIDQRPHAIQSIPPVGSHTWTSPTADQIKARMLARHAERNEAPMPTTPAATTPHTYSVTTITGGHDIDWAHPTNCPDGETCDFLRRIQRMGIESMSQLADGRPDGTYHLGRFGFHGLILVDEDGTPLPDVIEALSPAETAARQIAADVIRELAEVICEDPGWLVEQCEIIRRGQTMTHWEGAANDAIDTIINTHLGTMRAFAEPINRLVETPQSASTS